MVRDPYFHYLLITSECNIRKRYTGRFGELGQLTTNPCKPDKLYHPFWKLILVLQIGHTQNALVPYFEDGTPRYQHMRSGGLQD